LAWPNRVSVLILYQLMIQIVKQTRKKLNLNKIEISIINKKVIFMSKIIIQSWHYYADVLSLTGARLLILNTSVPSTVHIYKVKCQVYLTRLIRWYRVSLCHWGYIPATESCHVIVSDIISFDKSWCQCWNCECK